MEHLLPEPISPFAQQVSPTKKISTARGSRQEKGMENIPIFILYADGTPQEPSPCSALNISLGFTWLVGSAKSAAPTSVQKD